MASRKDEKERLRREREEREAAARAAERRKRMIGYGAGGALVAAVLVVLIVLLVTSGGDGGDVKGGNSDLLPDGGEVPRQQIQDLGRAARAAGCELRTTRVTSREHTDDLSRRIPYPTNPPTSGEHYFNPAEDGAYGAAPDDKEAVHSLEHGRVIVWFKPRLPERQRANLKALFDADSGFQMLMIPRANMPFAVAATAWNREPEPLGTGRLLGCPRLGDRAFDALRAFIDEHRGNGPEPVP